MRTAIVADWLPTFAGAEHVIAVLHDIYPDAPIHTTIANHGKLGPLDAADIHTSSLQPWYKVLKNHQLLLPWMPQAMERIDLSSYDTIISSSHAVGKGIVPPQTARHICYCHTPMRYAWEMEDEYLKDFHVKGYRKKIIKKLLKKLRRWDLSTAKRVDTFIANSTETQKRIATIYHRDSIVVPPPAHDRFFSSTISGEEGSYFLTVGRFVPYKRFDIVIEAANALQIPLKIAGTGQDEARLKALAGHTVEFLGFVPDDDLPALYANAKALVFPQLEDAGVVPIEAQACGTPVIAYGKGGVLDTVIDGTTGMYFHEQHAEAVTDALRMFDQSQFDANTIRAHAQKFTEARFIEAIRSVVEVNE